MASLECFVGQLIKVLLVATGEMAAAAEAHRLHDLTHAIEALVLALLGIDQQLPHPIQADRALQFERCALEVFLGSLEQRCSGLKNVAADLLNLQRCFRVLGAPVQ